MSVSAYMIAHCDDDYLTQAIDSVIDHVDELIFVDGAYAWVAPFLAPGQEADRSWPSTLEKLKPYGRKIRYFTGVWQDELHKRAFGFAQCRGDYILRVDADEIFDIDPVQLRLFRKSGKAVADMQFPYMVTDSLQRLEATLDSTPRQVCLFRRKSFKTALDHCSYLWLVLTEDERARCQPADWKQLYHVPVSRTAHVTGMRTPRTSVNRARFYTFQHIRSTGLVPFGLPVADDLSGDERIALALDYLGADNYTAWLEGSEIVSGFAHMTGFQLAPFELSPAQSAVVRDIAATHAKALASLLDVKARPRTFVSGTPGFIDVTAILKPNTNRISLTWSEEVVSASGHLYFLLGDNTAGDDRRLLGCVATVDGRSVHYDFAPVATPDNLRAVLVVLTEVPKDHKVMQLLDIDYREA